MRANETVPCPFCGHSNTLELDGALCTERFTTDCEVCCRPFEVFAVWEDGELVSIEADGN